jgi:hypothetical protein
MAQRRCRIDLGRPASGVLGSATVAEQAAERARPGPAPPKTLRGATVEASDLGAGAQRTDAGGQEAVQRDPSLTTLQVLGAAGLHALIAGAQVAEPEHLARQMQRRGGAGRQRGAGRRAALLEATTDQRQRVRAGCGGRLYDRIAQLSAGVEADHTISRGERQPFGEHIPNREGGSILGGELDRAPGQGAIALETQHRQHEPLGDGAGEVTMT